MGKKKYMSDNWDNGKEVKPDYSGIELPPKRCDACGEIFIPTYYKMRRCTWCRKNKIPYMDSSKLEKPF